MSKAICIFYFSERMLSFRKPKQYLDDITRISEKHLRVTIWSLHKILKCVYNTWQMILSLSLKYTVWLNQKLRRKGILKKSWKFWLNIYVKDMLTRSNCHFFSGIRRLLSSSLTHLLFKPETKSQSRPGQHCNPMAHHSPSSLHILSSVPIETRKLILSIITYWSFRINQLW